MKCKTHKKGMAFDEVIPLIAFILVAAVTYYAFNLYGHSRSEASTQLAQVQQNIADQHNALIGFFSMLNEDGTSNADALSEAYPTKNYDKIKKDIKSFFDIKFSHKQGWQLQVFDNKGIEIFIIKGGNDVVAFPYDTSSLIIPVNSTKTYVVASLFAGEVTLQSVKGYGAAKGG